jgi:hypothetical protein
MGYIILDSFHNREELSKTGSEHKNISGNAKTQKLRFHMRKYNNRKVAKT